MGYGSQNPRGMIGSTDGGQFEPYGVDPSIAPGLPRPEGWRVGLPDGSAAWDKVGPLDTDWALLTAAAGTVSSIVAGDGGIVVTNPAGPVVTVSQVIAAEWPIANFRIYTVDDVNGLDTNAGFADAAGTSSAQYAAACVAAGLVAKKTIAGLAAIFPRVGNGRLCEIIFANGGVNTEKIYAGSIADFLTGSVGWGEKSPTVRGTGTNTTAGSVAFAGTAAEFDYAGGVTITGCNAAGYNPTGAPTTSSVQCLQVGGGAAAIPVEPATVGWRMRFDANTTTAALRNVCRQIAQLSGSDTLIPQTAWPAVPVGTDVFYLEMGGVVCGAYTLGGTPNRSNQTVGPAIIGVRSSGAIGCTNDQRRFVFSGGASLSLSAINLVGAVQTYAHAILGTRTIGGGLRLEGVITAQVEGGSIIATGLVSAGAGTSVLDAHFNVRWGAGCYSRGRITMAGGAAAAVGAVANIGGLPVTLARPRITAGWLSLNAGNLAIGGSSIEGAGANPAIGLVARCLLYFMDNPCAGATGNNDVGLSLTSSRGSLIILGVTPTVTGALGDVRLAGGQIITWAQAVATGIVDSAGNRIIGTAGVPAQGLETKTARITSDLLAAAFNYMADVPPTLVTVNEVSPMRRPTSLRLMTRLRVSYIGGPNPAGKDIVHTLYKNGVATAMTVTIPAAAALFDKVVDLAHPILFLDGDDFDLRQDVAIAGGEGANVYWTSATVEWAS